ncbi:hypothetical protein [Sphingomonas sp. URHD0057]|uniref:hypothetical protein n=1 Tax=Sphingomonas sp. URHD0057 TaxID=1380389 RepID=UPI000ADD956D|nr:hypothetical protein [Sphingomonas sp. URHD0057]
MPFRTAIAALLLSIVSFLLLASAAGLRYALITSGGFVVLGLVLRENEKAKRAKDGRLD